VNQVSLRRVNLNTALPDMVNESADFVNHVFAEGKKMGGFRLPWI